MSGSSDSSPAALLAMSLQLGAAVAVPTVLLALGGRWLDVRFGTGSIFLVAGLALAFALSMALVWQIVKAAQGKLAK